IGLCRIGIDAKTFADWGWRIPFLISLVLLVFSVYIRLKLNESPVFQKMKAEGKGSKAPLTDSFLRYPNNKYVLLALLGATAGQSTCNFHIFVGPWSKFTDCDRAQDFLTKAGLSFAKEDAPGKAVAVAIGDTKVQGWDAAKWNAALAAAGYPKAADPAKINYA